MYHTALSFVNIKSRVKFNLCSTRSPDGIAQCIHLPIPESNMKVLPFTCRLGMAYQNFILCLRKQIVVKKKKKKYEMREEGHLW